MVKKQTTDVWKKTYLYDYNRNEHMYAHYAKKIGRLRHYKYVDPETKEKNSIYIYVGVFSISDSNNKWVFRVGAVAKNGAYIGALDSRDLKITYKSAEQAKAMALKSYKKWILTIPGVVYVK